MLALLTFTACFFGTALPNQHLWALSTMPRDGSPSPISQAHALYSGLWRTDGGFVSTIRIKNVLAVAPLDITPVIFMADGTPYPLRPVHLAISGVATININDALAEAPDRVGSHISQYGSAALLYSYSSPGHVTAQLAAVDASRSLSFVFPFAELGGEPMGETLEGLWWKRDPGVSGFVAFSNVTGADTEVSVQLVSPGNDAQAERTIALPAHSTRMLHLEDLADNPSPLAKRAGGIRVQYTGQPGSVQVMGGLENDAEGYSANIPFLGHDMSSASPGPITYASAGLLVGKPDPMMMPGFAKETTFSPYLVLRNTAEKPLEVSLQLNMMGMNGGAPVTQNLSSQHLGPLEARQVDMQTALNSIGLKSFNGSINLSTSFTGKAGDLVVATGSVDQTGTYVFEVEPQGVGASRSKFASYWGVSNGNDTMFTLWNPTSAAQDILVTFYYADGSGKYDLPVHVGPHASTMIDMAMLIAENKPDPDGHLIPSNIQEGSAQFASAKGRNEEITLVIAAGIYNVANATCIGGCISCCGVSNFSITPSQIICPVAGTMSFSFGAVDCNGFAVWPNFSSSNTAVMTVDGTHLAVTGVSTGQATLTLDWGNQFTTSNGGLQQFCGISSCPTTLQQASVPVTVFSATLACTPSSVTRGQNTTCSITVTGTSSGDSINYSSWKFTDGTNTVTSSNSAASWPGTVVTGGTVSAQVSVNGSNPQAVSASLTVTPRSGFAFTAVSPSQVISNTLTCYDGSTSTLPSPPSLGSAEGHSCPDMAFSFHTVPIADGGPNNGYQYVTNVSPVFGSQPTKYEYIVVSDLLSSSSTFYTSQCGTFSASNTSGAIAGSQLNQNVFDHEQGAVLSHWTEYRDAQNNSNNNIGTILEAMTAAPGTSSSAFSQSLNNAGQAAIGRIAQAEAGEPCGGSVNRDSSQSCKFCGGINFSPYQSCGGATPVPFCQ